jgi:serpin B
MNAKILLSGLAIAALSVQAVAQSTAPKATVQSSNDVGFQLMKQALKTEKQQKNMLFSPLSAHFALSMALNGTSGKTRTQLLSTLGYEASLVEGINQENADVLKQLTRAPLSAREAAAYPKYRPLPPVLTVSNSLWSTNGATDGQPYNFQPKFVKDLKASYAVDKPTSLDFKAKESADVINNWVSDATNKMIPSIIDADTLNPLTWVILNATRLEAQWQTPFNGPWPGDFTLMDNSKVKAKMMSRNAYGRYGRTDDFQVAELDLAGDQALKAYVVLPNDAKAFESLQASNEDGIWTKKAWETIFASLKAGNGKLTMPEFEFTSGFLMKKDQPLTKAMGLNFLYQNAADFSKMDGETSPPSKVGIIKQDAKIKWDNQGVAAAAATLIGGLARSAIFRSDYDMVVDRPFYVAIYDTNTQSFVFIGQVVDPTK